MAWSFTSLNRYETCPRQYDEVHNKKNKEPDGEASLWGKRVHTHLEGRAKGVPLPKILSQHEASIGAMIDAAKAGGFVVLPEFKLGLNARLEPAGFFDKDVWYRGVADLTFIGAPYAATFDYKGLPLDTDIPTPSGFLPMEDIEVGMRVFGTDGRPYRVTAKSETHHNPCFRLTFEEGSSVVCDHEHRWKLTDGAVTPTTELKVGYRMPLCAPVEFDPHRLPIDPYVFGLWLADGKHTSGEICKPDAFIWEEIQRRGYKLGDYAGSEDRCRAHTVRGIRGALTKLGVRGNKHIPQTYLTAATSERIDLLRGLMDGDGSVNPLRKLVVFSNTNKTLALQVRQLVESLGIRAYMATADAFGFGKYVTVYPISFKPWRFNPFLLPRKANLVGEWGVGQSDYRRLVKIEPVETVATQCLSVDSPDNTYLCTRHFLPTHNTGKRKSDFTQLELVSSALFAHYPAVQTIDAKYLWLQGGAPSVQTIARSDTVRIWQTIIPRVRRLESATVFDPKPNGLCRAHCFLTSCEHNGRYGT